MRGSQPPAGDLIRRGALSNANATRTENRLDHRPDRIENLRRCPSGRGGGFWGTLPAPPAMPRVESVSMRAWEARVTARYGDRELEAMLSELRRRNTECKAAPP